MEGQKEEELIQGRDGITYKAVTKLRTRKVREEQLAKRAKMNMEAQKQKRLKRKNPDYKDKIKRAEKFIMEYRAHQKNFVDQKKRAVKAPNENLIGKVVLAIRLRK